MFDTIAGLPVHALVVHAVVVLGPLSALLLVAYAARPRWRRGLRWPTVGLSALAAASAFVAVQAGEALERRVGEPGYEHADRGELAALSLYALFAVCLLVVFVLGRAGAERARVAGPLLVGGAAAVFAVVAVLLAGHSGAEAVWKVIVDNTVPR